MTQSQPARSDEPAGENDSTQVHTEIKAVQFDPRLLPIYEEHHRHKMQLEMRRQEDTTKVVLQKITDTTAITKRGQSIAAAVAILALIGGFFLIAIDKDVAGFAILVMDAVFVFSQKLIRPSHADSDSRHSSSG